MAGLSECGVLWSGVSSTVPPPTGSASPAFSPHRRPSSSHWQACPARSRTTAQAVGVILTRFPATGPGVALTNRYSDTLSSWVSRNDWML
jgi:hypothetical protein